MKQYFQLLILASLCLLVGCADSFCGHRTITKKLRQGSENGTYRFLYKGKVKFSRHPIKEVQVCVIGDGREKFYTTQIKDDFSFKIDTNLAAGEYAIYSDIINEQPLSGYWGSFGGRLTISKDGLMTFNTQPIIHQLKIKLKSPVERVVINEKRPALKWDPIEGAKQYSISWYKDGDDVQMSDIRQGMRTSDTKYVIEEDLSPNETYCWSIHALDESNMDFAYYSVGSFITGENLQ